MYTFKTQLLEYNKKYKLYFYVEINNFIILHETHFVS